MVNCIRCERRFKWVITLKVKHRTHEWHSHSLKEDFHRPPSSDKVKKGKEVGGGSTSETRRIEAGEMGEGGGGKEMVKTGKLESEEV